VNPSQEIRKFYDTTVSKRMLPKMLFSEFGQGELVKTTWREKWSDILHFRIPQREKFVPKRPLPRISGRTIQFRKWDGKTC